MLYTSRRLTDSHGEAGRPESVGKRRSVGGDPDCSDMIQYVVGITDEPYNCTASITDVLLFPRNRMKTDVSSDIDPVPCSSRIFL